MPYTLRTKDGITLDNIPDDVDPNDQRLKSLVNDRRVKQRQERFNSPEFQAKVAAQEEADRELYNPTKGMSGGEKVAANLGAGITNFGRGLAQLALPKSMEAQFGITDESTNEKRARDDLLAQNTTGGKALQILGEATPGLMIPGGAVARGLGALPKAGNALRAAGVGTRAVPTLMAEGAALGGMEGLITPTTSNESALANTMVGAAGGAAVPAALGLGKMGLRPFSRGLQQEQVATKLGELIPASAPVAKTASASSKRVVDAPQSLAALTQNPEVAALEMAARANPGTAASWARFDETAGNARWKALTDVLGSDKTVEAAKKETDAFANTAIPEVFKAVNKTKLAESVRDFGSAVQGRLNASVKGADPAGQEVYGYVKQALEAGDGSPRMLWNIRKTLSNWIDGTPPPGKEGTRGTKLDREIMEVRNAIDNTLNRSTGGKKWSRFLERFGEYAQKEKAQKAGQNIRNAFFDETLASTRGPTTAAGNPAVTRAKLESALQRFGKDDFGETLNWEQRNVVDQVMSDLRADEILQRAKSSMTSKGGSQTAPLLALMKREGVKTGGPWLTEMAQWLGNVSADKQRAVLNDVLQSPEDALTVIRQAERLKRPLSKFEKYLVQAARGLITSPSLYFLSNQRGNPPAESPQ